jgi:plastocyanin
VSRRPRALRAGLALCLALVALGGCGDDGDGEGVPDDCHEIEDGKVTLVGENIAWDKTCLRVKQGTEVTFTVINKDRSVEHDLAVFGPAGRKKTDLEPGPATQTLVYDFTIDGLSQYECTIHPAMNGDIWVE